MKIRINGNKKLFLSGKNLMEIATYLFYFLVLFSLEGNNGEDLPGLNSSYVFFGIYLLIGILCLLRKKKIMIEKKVEDFFPVVILLVWFYGVILGFLKGNPTAYIIRNFAGMVVYIVYYIMINCKWDLKVIAKIITTLSYITVYITILTYIDYYVLGLRILPQGRHIIPSSYAVLFSMRQLIYVSYAICLYRILVEKKKSIFWIIHIISTWYAVVVCEKADGDLLALFVITIMIVTSIPFVLSQSKRKKQVANIFLILGTVLGIFIFLVFIPNNFIANIFSENAGGNSIRYLQIEYVFKHFDFWGHGLGAIFSSELGPKYSGGYAIEVIYLNLFHKFGIFGVILIMIYVVTFYETIKIVRHNQISYYNAVPLACAGYMISSIGNPMLLAVGSILLHCYILCCVRFYKLNEKKNACISS